MADSKVIEEKKEEIVSPVDSEQVTKASKALLAYILDSSKAEAKSGKRNLLDVDADDNEDGIGSSTAEMPIWLTVATKQHVIETRRLQPSKIAVPHPLNKDESSDDNNKIDESTICLITADPQRAFKDLVADEAFPASLRKRITRVIDIGHLQKKFKSYEAQRKLFAEHDHFLGDERILNRLPQALGKTFYKSTAKRPLPVVLVKTRTRTRGADGKKVKPAPLPKKAKKSKKEAVDKEAKDAEVQQALRIARTPEQLAAEIRRALSATYAYLAPSTNTAIKVGAAGWPAEHIAENAQTAAEVFVRRHVPQQWNNVKALYLKGPRTMAVPFWQTDALWVDEEADVLKAGSDELKAYEAKRAAKREKANIGKKRKANDETEEEKKTEEKTEKKDKKDSKKDKDDKPTKKSKKALPESNDNSLDKQIAEHKALLKKQKEAAKKAMGI